MGNHYSKINRIILIEDQSTYLMDLVATSIDINIFSVFKKLILCEFEFILPKGNELKQEVLQCSVLLNECLLLLTHNFLEVIHEHIAIPCLYEFLYSLHIL